MKLAWTSALLVGALVIPGRATAGERFLADPERATECQAALLGATLPFAQKKLKQLDKCAMAAFKCIQTVAPDDEADVDPVELCLERASLKCEKAAEVVAAEEQKLVDAITERCAALDPAELLRADGVGFDAIATDCLDFGVTLGDLASVAECVMLEHECAVDRMYLFANPRAGEMFSLVGADFGPDSCVDDLGGPGEGVFEDLRLGRRITTCQQTVSKTGAGFAGAKLKAMGRCLGELFDCVQLDAHDDGTCLRKAAKTCDKAFATVAASALKFEPTVNQSCEPIPFGDVTAETGIDYDALVEEELCTDVGVFGILTVPHYSICAYRQHECAADEILRFSSPRAEELLGLVGRTLPGSFFCFPADDEL